MHRTRRKTADHVRIDSPDGKKKVVWDPSISERGWSAKDLIYANPPLPLVSDAVVVITEGEKDADAAANRGLTALGTCCGASSSPTSEVLEWAGLGGRKVILWPDYDAPGMAHMTASAHGCKKWISPRRNPHRRPARYH